MKFKVIFSPQSLKDIREARAWYNLQQKGLGKRFYEDVKLAARSIETNPFYAAVRYRDMRAALCKTFPYKLHYEIDDENGIVRITSVFHASREPLT